MIDQIHNGLKEANKFEKTLSESEYMEAHRYIRSINESLKLIKDLKVYDKRHSLINLDIGDKSKYTHNAQSDDKLM